MRPGVDTPGCECQCFLPAPPEGTWPGTQVSRIRTSLGQYCWKNRHPPSCAQQTQRPAQGHALTTSLSMLSGMSRVHLEKAQDVENPVREAARAF